jgi:formate hydrogenlyase transcriptional activator
VVPRCPLREEVNVVHDFPEIVGQSPAVRAVFDQVNLVATTDSTVLLLGETGTGKELVARAIHSHSLRKNRPLINVNCAALPAGLIDSRLFGHEKGAFTGAIKQQIGRFELANSGSIFLDEIGDMSADAQAKLLRVLQEHEVERLGGQSAVKVDVRVIVATNRDLQQSVARGTFREDLYYRLNVFPLRVPALRERLEDIPLLVDHFLARYTSKLGRQIAHVPSQIMGRLLEYSWPGNVRELENVIELAVIVSTGPDLQLAAESLSPSIAVAPAQDGRLRSAKHPSAISENAEPTALVEIERNHILNILRRTGWRIEGPAGTAHALNLKPSTLRSLMKKLGINRSSG